MVGGGNEMNFHNVCFLLQRFMRVVSSKFHPVMLFFGRSPVVRTHVAGADSGHFNG